MCALAVHSACTICIQCVLLNHCQCLMLLTLFKLLFRSLNIFSLVSRFKTKTQFFQYFKTIKVHHFNFFPTEHANAPGTVSACTFYGYELFRDIQGFKSNIYILKCILKRTNLWIFYCFTKCGLPHLNNRSL